MKLSVEGPAEFQGNIMRHHQQRRGMITGLDEGRLLRSVEAEVPLSEMFGYSTVLRSATQGKAEFTMEFAKYADVPSNIGEELLAKAAKAKADAKK
jgi:elongation factor G